MALLFKFIGAGIVQTRIHTIVWGCILLLGVVRFTWSFRDKSDESWMWTGVWAALICAVDFTFLLHSDGRPDMMCAALGIWGLALGSEWLVALSFLVHPYGILYAAVLLLIKKKINLLPYLLAILVWVCYISQEPDAFVTQMWGQIIAHIIVPSSQGCDGRAVWQAYAFGWRLLILAVYVWCSATMALTNRRMMWALGILALIGLLTNQAPYYLGAHGIPLFAICTAICMRRDRFLTLILPVELVFAVTTLIPLWNWKGIYL
jgi:hypothetical protein